MNLREIIYHMLWVASPLVALEMADRAGLAPTKASALGILCYLVAFSISVIFARQAPYGMRFYVWFIAGNLAPVITQFV